MPAYEWQDSRRDRRRSPRPGIPPSCRASHDIFEGSRGEAAGAAVDGVPCMVGQAAGLANPRLISKTMAPRKIQKKKLLLVDDDPSVREALANVLVGEDYEVVPAGDGVEALDLAARMPLDLVLL